MCLEPTVSYTSSVVFVDSSAVLRDHLLFCLSFLRHNTGGFWIQSSGRNDEVLLFG